MSTELRDAARALDDFAWSAVTCDCDEATEYLRSLIQNLRGALALCDTATPEQQLRSLSRAVWPVLQAVKAGMTYDPGHSDLDDEQPVNVRMTLGDYRRACRLQNELEKQC